MCVSSHPIWHLHLHLEIVYDADDYLHHLRVVSQISGPNAHFHVAVNDHAMLLADDDLSVSYFLADSVLDFVCPIDVNLVQNYSLESETLIECVDYWSVVVNVYYSNDYWNSCVFVVVAIEKSNDDDSVGNDSLANENCFDDISSFHVKVIVTNDLVTVETELVNERVICLVFV